MEGEDPNLERTEDPHVTIMWKAKSWRYNIRRTGFMDREPDPKEEVVAHIGKKLTKLREEWDGKHPENPIEAGDRGR